MMKRYCVREDAPPFVHEALALYPERLRNLLFSRGIDAPAAAERFLKPDYVRDSHDPYLMPDMEKAVDRVRVAANRNEVVAVWSDYDCDGIPGGVALSEFLRAIGCRVRHYIPHRHEEGFGLNREGLEELANEGTRLVITVDLGTTDVDQIAHARDLGMEVIVTDHHLPPETLPEAFAILNPYRSDSRYPFQHLCGAGVAWKLIQGVLGRDRFGLSEGKEKWLLDLIGLATLSDMVPLIDENRMLASYGLVVMRRNRRPGFSSLLSLLRISPRTLSEDDVGFMISPRINAASRMERPETAARLLATDNAEEADELARTLNRINDERKGVVAVTVKEARQRLKNRSTPSPLIVMGSPKWRPGILGLVATKLVESEGVPVFLWGREGSEKLKGSCRSDGRINMVELMGATRELFLDFGGHEFSGGFSMEEDNAHKLEQSLTVAYEQLSSAQQKEHTTILDAQLSLEEIPQMFYKVQQLSPFGEGNEKPLFLFPNVSISRMRTFGKGADHLELSLTGERERISGISFFSTPESFQKTPREGVRADIVGHIEKDFRNRPRLRVVDVIS